MNKLFIIPLVLVLAFGAIIAVPLTSTKTVSASASIATTPKMSIMPLSAPPTSGDTGDTVEANVYTKDGQRMFYLEETGMVIAEDGTPIMNPNDSSIVIYDEENQAFIDGANRALSIFLDSKLERHYLRSGGQYTAPINMNSEVFLINLKLNTGSTMVIYAFREEVKKGFWDNFNPFYEKQYIYKDMNNRVIDPEHITEMKNAVWWKHGVAWLCYGPFAAFFYLGGSHIVPYVPVLEKTTLRELSTLISHATVHPWDTIKCGQTGLPVVTEDGRIVYVNPRTNQLVDFFGWALFNKVNGLPILFHNNDIITTNGQQQAVENAVLINSMTVWNLLESGTDFYMHIVPSPYGSFDTPVINHGTDKEPDFRLLNGESTEGITIFHETTAVLTEGESFGAWLNRVFGGSENSGGSNFLLIAGIVLGVIILILLWPIIKPIISLIAVPFTILVAAAKSSTKKQNKKEKEE